MNPRFHTGGIPDVRDGRDYQWKELGGALPPFDWTVGYDVEEELSEILQAPDFRLAANDQGQSESCGGQSWSKYAAVRKAVFAKKFDERSAKFIYSQVFQPPGGGSRGRDNCEILIKQGCCSEALCPSYQNGQPPTEAFMEQKGDITPPAQADARFDEALSYASVLVDMEDVALAIKNNHGMAIGFRGIWDSANSWNSLTPIPPPSGTPVNQTWGHWVYAGKARIADGQKKIGILNSWGNKIGDRGWQWIAEDYFTTTLQGGVPACMGGWTLVFNPSPAPQTFSHNFTSDLFFGSTSDEVKALQQALQIDGEFPLAAPASGVYGNLTAQAVLAFQLKYSVSSVDELHALQGRKVGPATRGKLNQLFNKQAPG